MTASYRSYILDFKRPGGTSRGVLTRKETWFIFLHHNGNTGIGECGLLRGLSIDDVPDYESKLEWVCKNITLGWAELSKHLQDFPSIIFGLEMALRSLESHDPFILFPSKFTTGDDAIPINGLIWMGDKSFMEKQVKEKIESGFKCIKMKIGAIDIETEFNILSKLRKQFTADTIEIRVDANGAFKPENALERLKRLSDLDLHSIEQPIAAKQYDEMARLCESTPLPIALDEDLIGIHQPENKKKLLDRVKPQYIILKPSLIGGFAHTTEWIDLANNNETGWWLTSALESNVGLNAIAQYTYNLGTNMFQGLGTGSLYTNNFISPLVVKNGTLRHEPETLWHFNLENQ
ncbi:MAG: o-succinylbenzoate synthase [Bacteroidia bacterium]|nr:o-succinylbenzoate synthase [Bacteroidia bacterium]